MMNGNRRNGHAKELVTIVIPAKDEEAAIGETLQSLPVSTLRMMGFEAEIFILDGNSKDATCEIAARHGATIIKDREPGKGAAVRHARELFSGTFVVMLDADGTYAADAIPRLVNRLAWGEADVVMGVRILQPGAMSLLHRFGNAMLSMEASLLYGHRARDVCTGLWGFRREALRALPLEANGFELEAELFSTANRLGFRITHVPVDYLPRKGETKLSTSDGLRIGWCLLRTRFMRLPTARARSNRPPEGRPTYVEVHT